MSDEGGFAIVAATLLVALAVFFSLGVAIVVEQSRLTEKATRAQQVQTLGSREDLKVVASASGNWSYRVPITVSAGGSGMPENYQVKVALNTAALISSGKMRSDAGDLRFTWADGAAYLSYWIENGVNTPQTIVWVRDPDALAANASHTIYAYYGNPSATSTSDGNATFPLFDDFLGTSLDAARWTVGTGSASVANSIVSIGASGVRAHIYSNTSWGAGIAVRFRALVPSGDDSQNGWGSSWELSDAGNKVTTMGIGTTTWYIRVNGGTTSAAGPAGGVWRTFELRWLTNSTALYGDDALYVTNTNTTPTGSYPLRHGINTTGETIQIDWTATRKLVSPEPTASVGSEMPAPSAQSTYTVINKGTVPSVIVATLVRGQDGTLTVYENSPVFIGAFENGSFAVAAAANDRIGVLTQLGNVFWVQ